MKADKVKIPSEFTVGMTPEERKEFIQHWTNASWLTDKIKRNVLSKLDTLIKTLINPGVGTDVSQVRADIKAYQTLERMLP